eukprot:1159491-Pelagomonas_calceolata.AAC.17
MAISQHPGKPNQGGRASPANAVPWKDRAGTGRQHPRGSCGWNPGLASSYLGNAQSKRMGAASVSTESWSFIHLPQQCTEKKGEWSIRCERNPGLASTYLSNAQRRRVGTASGGEDLCCSIQREYARGRENGDAVVASNGIRPVKQIFPGRTQSCSRDTPRPQSYDKRSGGRAQSCSKDTPRQGHRVMTKDPEEGRGSSRDTPRQGHRVMTKDLEAGRGSCRDTPRPQSHSERRAGVKERSLGKPH